MLCSFCLYCFCMLKVANYKRRVVALVVETVVAYAKRLYHLYYNLPTYDGLQTGGGIKAI